MRTTSASFLLVLCILAASAFGGDWPAQRGPNGDGTSRERNLPEKWSPVTGENLLWSNKISGICTPIVMKGRVYVTTRVGEEQVDGQLFAGPRTQEALVCIDAETGKPLWEYRQPPAGASVTFEELGGGGATGDPETGRVYALFSDMSLVCLEGADGKVVWKRQLAEELGATSQTSPPQPPEIRGVSVTIGGIFGLWAFEKESGRLMGKKPSAARAGTGPAAVRADDKLYVASPDGVFSIIKPAGSGDQVLSRVELREKPGRNVAIGGSPAISNGRIYLQTSAGMYCIGSKTWDRKEDAPPTRPAEPSPGWPKTLLLIPAEATLRGGETIKLDSRFLDENGRATGFTTTRPYAPQAAIRVLATTRRATTTPSIPSEEHIANVPGFGQLDASMLNFTADDGSICAGKLAVTVNEVTGRSFIRIFPALPWHFDFINEPVGSTPAIFVGAPLIITERNGKRVLSRKAGPSATYFGTPDMSNYTIQADVMLSRGPAANLNPPGEAGLINSKFILSLTDNGRQLRIHTWPGGLPRGLVKSVDYRWDAESWHTLKLSVETTPDKAIVRGKAWPAGAPEPAAWTIELEDTTYTRGGCPGLFGRTDFTIFYDRIMVTGVGR